MVLHGRQHGGLVWVTDSLTALIGRTLATGTYPQMSVLIVATLASPQDRVLGPLRQRGPRSTKNEAPEAVPC